MFNQASQIRRLARKIAMQKSDPRTRLIVMGETVVDYFKHDRQREKAALKKFFK